MDDWIPLLPAGSPAPAFTLASLNGEPVSLSSLHAGRPVLLAFFKVTCPTCQLAVPFLDRLASRGGVHVVGISQDDAADTEEFRAAFGVHFPLLLDPAEKRYAVSAAYRLSNVPTLYRVETDGRIGWSSVAWVKSVFEEVAIATGIELFKPYARVPAFKPGGGGAA